MRLILLMVLAAASALPAEASLRAGAAKVDITRDGADAGDNPPFVKALAITDDATGESALIITVDAVAIAEIGSIRDPFLANVRAVLRQELGIDPKTVLVNASHCHAVVCADIEERTLRAARLAWKSRIPVRVAVGAGHEDRIMENRRLHMKDGTVVDVRRGYSLPPDDQVAAVGPIDPEIGIVRLDSELTGRPLALLYHFSCHPIQGAAGGGNTADLTGYASAAMEAQLGEGAVALFLQGCGGDINPANYKIVDHPRDARPLGNALALSTLKTALHLESQDDVTLATVNETISLPRADLAKRIGEMKAEILELVQSLKGTSLNLETFLPLYVKYRLRGETPATHAMRYLQDEALGVNEWKHLDEVNRRDIEAYVRNVRTMEELTRKRTNLALLEKHQARNQAAKSSTVDAEVVGLRIGNFRLVTFPAELTVPIGLGIKQRSAHDLSFVSGYTNGYLYYAPTAEQLRNRGGAQEDSDCLFAPGWQAIFEATAVKILEGL